MARTAAVMMARVPSDPTRIWSRSGPVADLGVLRVWKTEPSAKTPSSEMTKSSILPYLAESCPAERVESQPPTVEQ